MHTLFISDLHLGELHPETTDRFMDFTRGIACHADALYILGDLFEYWAGDDDCDTPFHRTVIAALRTLSEQVPVYLMHGNRDFLLLENFASASGTKLISDPVLLDLYGIPTLLTHGDSLCTDDIAYQEFREQVRRSEWQQQFLSLPLNERKKLISGMRMRSEQEKLQKSLEIMDVNDEAVADAFREHGYPRMIHGHTHRRGMTLHRLDGHTCERWTLGDWETETNALHCNATGMRWVTNW